MSRSYSSLSLSADPLQVGLHADVWHAHTLATPLAQVVATGAAVLDAQLPGGGWPVGALTELLQAPHQHSEWQLLAPALACCGTAAVVLVAPPYVPFGPALSACGVASQRLLWVHPPADQSLWATEQALRCAGVDAVLAWLPQARADQLRRLQMAASDYNRLLFVMRPGSARQESSPAALRIALALEPQPELAREPGSVPPAASNLHVCLHILKRRGPPLDQPVHLPACGPALARWLAAVQNPWPQHPAVLPTGLEVPRALDRAAA